MVTGNVTIGAEGTQRVTITGDVHLILANGCTLTVNGGISVTKGNSLTIYAQSTGDGMGKLVAKSTDYAGIGAGGNITINGGTVTSTGGGFGAGIGGGYKGAGGNITISGGTVKATGGEDGAGIGGGRGSEGGSITISGGTVTATGGKDGGAGIGGGKNGESGTFTTGAGGSAFIVASSISD